MLNDIKSTCVINWQDLFKRIPDEEIIVEFALSFVKNSRKLMESLHQAVASGDPEQIELFAHALKGSASNMGAIGLAKIAWQLEKSASEQQIDTAQEWLTKIDAEFQAVNAFLQQPDWVQQAKDSACVENR